jgi:hypothetical protein
VRRGRPGREAGGAKRYEGEYSMSSYPMSVFSPVVLTGVLDDELVTITSSQAQRDQCSFEGGVSTRYSSARQSSNDEDEVVHEPRSRERGSRASGANVRGRRSARASEKPRNAVHFVLRLMNRTLRGQLKNPVINTHGSRTNSATHAQRGASPRELDVVNQNAETCGPSLECDI